MLKNKKIKGVYLQTATKKIIPTMGIVEEIATSRLVGTREESSC